MPVEPRPTIESVSAFGRPYERFYDLYQRYYRHGLQLHCEATGVAFAVENMTRAPSLLRPLRGIRDRYVSRLPAASIVSAVDRIAHAAEGPIHTPSSLFHNAVGQYLFETRSGAPCRVCIDSADYPHLPSPELVTWSDLYFKANRWPSHSYPPNVLPLVNGDPMILRRIPTLQSYRGRAKDYDVSFIVRVRGGRDEVEGIEHNVRLLEAINRARCSKQLIAYLVTGDIDTYSRRLRRSGITVRTHAVRQDDLWRMMASSRLNVVRLGLHYCISWRVAGALAIGGCLVFDQSPPASWPEPLKEDINFFNLGASALESPVADAEEYSSIPEKIEFWLEERQKIEEIMVANAKYFDEFVHPQRVGEYIFNAVESRVSGH